MLVVIQCAATKDPDAGTLWTRDGKRVLFVARPERAPSSGEVVWARPDDASDDAGATWRDLLEVANRRPDPGLGLRRAFELYEPPAFRRLATRFGIDRLFILSAGWGLVRASYLLPQYDITFSKQAESYKQRTIGDPYRDFNQLPPAPAGSVVFLGGRDYLPLFAKLTRTLPAPLIVPFRCDPADETTCVHHDGHLRLVPYRTAAKTNWHYGCADQLCRDPSFLERMR
jgi:hypothetical protein